MQDDILFDYLQVKEALTFAARLRLPQLSRDQQDARVEKILKDLGLVGVQNTQIGSPFRKIISGGERKRTAIGVELITDPRVILLDEPTSGLDSFKANSIAKLLKKLARQEGKTIISTIHQPSSQTFAEFDRLLFLIDGHVAFQGYAHNLPKHFAMIGAVCPIRQNPSDFYMQYLSVMYPISDEDNKKI